MDEERPLLARGGRGLATRPSGDPEYGVQLGSHPPKPQGHFVYKRKPIVPAWAVVTFAIMMLTFGVIGGVVFKRTSVGKDAALLASQSNTEPQYAAHGNDKYGRTTYLSGGGAGGGEGGGQASSESDQGGGSRGVTSVPGSLATDIAAGAVPVGPVGPVPNATRANATASAAGGSAARGTPPAADANPYAALALEAAPGGFAPYAWPALPSLTTEKAASSPPPPPTTATATAAVKTTATKTTAAKTTAAPSVADSFGESIAALAAPATAAAGAAPVPAAAKATAASPPPKSAATAAAASQSPPLLVAHPPPAKAAPADAKTTRWAVLAVKGASIHLHH